MSKEIVIDVSYNQVRIGLLEEGDLVEIYIDNKECQRKVGNIYQGKVENILPGMQAAFVNIGLEKNAFLYKGDIKKSLYELEDTDDCVVEKLRDMSISDVIKQGQHITVQVVKDAIGTKGPRVTTHITLPGRYLVLMPTVNYVGVSRKIDDEYERNRLKGIVEAIKPESIGVIVRTAAEGKDAKRLKEDLHCLLKTWENIRKKAGSGRVPKLIFKEESLIYRILRDLFTDDIDKLIINDEKEYKNIMGLLDVTAPALKGRVFHYEGDVDIFDYYQIESKINKALNKKVWLKCGGYIVIDQTEALSSIDVNTGKFVGTINLQDTVLRTNIEAAEEIAKQLRLRNIGGIIIIDFIDMDNDEHKELVIDHLRQALKKDKTKTSVLGFTTLGLVEMTRKKVTPRLSSILQKPCPYCRGLGRVLDENTMIAKILKEIERKFHHTKGQAVWVQVHPSIALLLEKGCYRELIKDLESKYNRNIYIIKSSDVHAEKMNIKVGDVEVSKEV